MASASPYGSWPSPVSADLIARSGGVRFSMPWPTAEAIYWIESRPLEGGRNVVRRREPGAPPTDVTPEGFNVRTKVHEYGGGAFALHGNYLFFSNFEDQRLYRQELPGGTPDPITPEPAIPGGARYADGRVLPAGDLLVCVRELHGEGEAVNEIVALSTDGSGDPRTIVSGHDFFAFPRISADGKRLAWTSWDHPRMPWDGCELWVADLSADGTVANERLVAGGPQESIFQPEWSPDGLLHFVSDRTGWWNLYRERGGRVESLLDMEAEFGHPQWVFGMSTYAFLGDGRIVDTYFSEGRDRLALIEGAGALTEVESDMTFISYVRAYDATAFFVGATATQPQGVMALDVASGTIERLDEGPKETINTRYISVPEAIEFPTEGNVSAHALYYAPVNPDVTPPADEKPPLIVFVHGGPTGHVTGELQPDIQFWTSRGIAVVDVNYGGSTGYGRAYRERLNGQWGVVDTVDAVNAARYLADRGDVDPARMAISGGSAGGWTVLCALTFHDVFRAGANYFGVSDLQGFIGDTHKFESRYIDSLVGPWPEAKDLYYRRSPVNFLDRLSCPIIVLQGLEDEIVPPSQSELVVEALKGKRIPHAYLAFEGEQHGFRKAETIKRALEAELYFYSRIFGFEPADEIEPVEIEGL